MKAGSETTDKKNPATEPEAPLIVKPTEPPHAGVNLGEEVAPGVVIVGPTLIVPARPDIVIIPSVKE